MEEGGGGSGKEGEVRRKKGHREGYGKEGGGEDEIVEVIRFYTFLSLRICFAN